MSSFKKLVAGTVLTATAFGVIAPLEVKATPSPGEDWAYVGDDAESQPCVPQVSVSDNVVDNTIRIRIREDNTCPVSGNLFIFIQDDRPQPLRLKAVYHHHNSWAASIGDARPGRYRVMGISPTPSGIGDYSYLTSRELGIDQVIAIGSGEMAQAASTPPPVVLPPARRQQEPRPEPSQAQGQWASVDLEALFNCFLRTPIRFNGWMIDFSPWKACLPH